MQTVKLCLEIRSLLCYQASIQEETTIHFFIFFGGRVLWSFAKTCKITHESIWAEETRFSGSSGADSGYA